MYSGGVDADGNKAAYNGNLHSAGLLISGAAYKNNNLQMQVWNYFAENIFNTVYNRADVNLPINNKRLHILLGAEMLWQNRLHNGGNNNARNAYIQMPENAFVFGSMAGIKNDKLAISLNYLRITSHNRYLMPREWEKEQFYVTLPRERVEGSGDVNAANIKLEFTDSTTQLNFEAAYGVYNMPDVKNYKLNKYGLPSYDQLYFSLTKHGKGFFKNTDTRLIYTYKRTLGNTYNDAKYILNKGNMHHADLIFNFNF